jgi:hypothetical protein
MTLRPIEGVAMNPTTELPAPSSKHATCAWCRMHFDTITELIDHVDGGHTDTVDFDRATVRHAA